MTPKTGSWWFHTTQKVFLSVGSVVDDCVHSFMKYDNGREVHFTSPRVFKIRSLEKYYTMCPKPPKEYVDRIIDFRAPKDGEVFLPTQEGLGGLEPTVLEAYQWVNMDVFDGKRFILKPVRTKPKFEVGHYYWRKRDKTLIKIINANAALVRCDILRLGGKSMKIACEYYPKQMEDEFEPCILEFQNKNLINHILDFREPRNGEYYISATGYNVYKKHKKTNMSNYNDIGYKRLIVDKDYDDESDAEFTEPVLEDPSDELLYTYSDVHIGMEQFNQGLHWANDCPAFNVDEMLENYNKYNITGKEEEVNTEIMYSVETLKAQAETAWKARLDLYTKLQKEKKVIVDSMANSLVEGEKYEGPTRVIHVSRECFMERYNLLKKELELISTEQVCRKDLSVDPLKLITDVNATDGFMSNVYMGYNGN